MAADRPVALWALCKRAPIPMFGAAGQLANLAWVGACKAAGVPWDITMDIAVIGMAAEVALLGATFMGLFVLLCWETWKTRSDDGR